MRPVVCFCLLMAFTAGLNAQDMEPDTILNLNDVNIYSSRISRFAKGQEVITIDSLTRTEYPDASLAQLMTGYTSSYVRNYGGALSTLSFRGTSANHAGLLWNGIRISPPNIGYVDLSLVQGSYFKNISILYGGASPMFGSGSIGGGIHLENKPEFDKSGFDLGLSLSLGNFGDSFQSSNTTLGQLPHQVIHQLDYVIKSTSIMTEGDVEFYKNRFYSRTAFSFVDAPNKFPYDNLQGSKDTLVHAAILKGGFIQDFAYKLAGNQYLMASTWFQYAHREIPPTLTEEKSEAVQMDRSWRTMLLWKDYNARNILEAKLAYFNEFTLYDDLLSSVYSTIKSQSAVGAFESTWDIFENSALFAGTQFTFEYADLVNYTKPESQDNLAIFASFRQNVPVLKWQFSVNGRQEFITGYTSPFLFSAGGEGKIWRFISGRFNVSRNFRAPTLNERFWKPGGDPGLKPEESWNEEAGITTENKFSESDIKFSLTAYNSRVQNWIIWIPGGSVWYVHNAQEVWARGIEISGNQSFNINSWNLFLEESWSYTKSTNEKKLFELDASYKKQLIYTPLNRVMIKTGVIYKGFNLTLRGDYTGEVFTSTDNSSFLPAYFLLDAIFSKTFKCKNEYPLTVQLNVNNVLNADYQVTPYRPMPGVNFLLTVKGSISR